LFRAQAPQRGLVRPSKPIENRCCYECYCRRLVVMQPPHRPCAPRPLDRSHIGTHARPRRPHACSCYLTSQPAMTKALRWNPALGLFLHRPSSNDRRRHCCACCQCHRWPLMNKIASSTVVAGRLLGWLDHKERFRTSESPVILDKDPEWTPPMDAKVPRILSQYRRTLPPVFRPSCCRSLPLLAARRVVLNAARPIGQAFAIPHQEDEHAAASLASPTVLRSRFAVCR
jgi:hypothetical protein